MFGRDDLKNRGIWQDESGEKAATAEGGFFNAFESHFQGSEFTIRKHPQDLKNIYLDVSLPDEEMQAIYNPPEGIKQHGITPDFAIDNTRTQKTIYVEIKRQDGWVEGKQRSAGRGNAHERSCKYFTPGLLLALRAHANIQEAHLPFWLVLQGDITRDPCRVREIILWFDVYRNNCFFWRDNADNEVIYAHFEQHIKPIIS